MRTKAKLNIQLSTQCSQGVAMSWEWCTKHEGRKIKEIREHFGTRSRTISQGPWQLRSPKAEKEDSKACSPGGTLYTLFHASSLHQLAASHLPFTHPSVRSCLGKGSKCVALSCSDLLILLRQLIRDEAKNGRKVRLLGLQGAREERGTLETWIETEHKRERKEKEKKSDKETKHTDRTTEKNTRKTTDCFSGRSVGALLVWARLQTEWMWLTRWRREAGRMETKQRTEEVRRKQEHSIMFEHKESVETKSEKQQSKNWSEQKKTKRIIESPTDEFTVNKSNGEEMIGKKEKQTE